MAIDSKNLLVWVKAMSRGQALPLDASEVYNTLAEAETYASSSAIAYPGQTVKAKLEDGKYHTYILQPSEAGYVLEEVGAIDESDLKQYVQVVETLPTTGQIQGVLYINNTDGYIWTGSAWKKVFWDVTSDVTGVANRVKALEDEMPNKAPLASPVFSGTVKVGDDEVALKSYVEGLFANLVSTAPGIVDSTHALPATGYKAGQTFRVAEAGTYAGIKCETGDLIMVVKDHGEGASNDDFMVIQANIDGAVTSSAATSTVGEIVVFDAVTGKVVKGSGVQIASLNDAIAKAHEHTNKDVLDTYTRTMSQLHQDVMDDVGTAISELTNDFINPRLANKADKATTLAGYGITDAYTKTEMDASLKTITDNLNTKITGAEADTKIVTAKTEILSEAATNANTALEERVGAIPADTTIQSYIDTAVGSGGTASAQAIAAAKQEAIDASKTYTDNALTIVEF